MPELAKAYVQIIPSAEGIKGNLSRIMDGEAESAGKSAGGKFGSTFGSVAKVGLAAAGAGLAAGAAAATAMAKSAVQGYAEYEQLQGGLETMFEDLAWDVEENANRAFQTAGLSANEYMETVMGFSASLNQSLIANEGDISRAADLSDQIITDMADNANKMGTSMESIQNAYAGFAKQNYTMLDNLKLGYGGTKEEMERLMADAEKLTGKKYDVSNFADVAEAIHAIQTEIGITGTTALEGSTTISGSLASMGAAWNNLIVGMASDDADMSGLINNVVTSAETAFGNILPVAEQALVGIASFVEEIAPVIAEKLPGIVSAVLPSILSAATSLLSALVSALPSLVQVLIEQGPVIIQQLLDSALSMLPEVISLGLTLIVSLANSISAALPELIPVAIDAILELVSTLTDPANLSALIDSAIAIIMALANGLIEALPQLLAQAPVIIGNLVTSIIRAAPQLLSAALKIIVELVSGIGQNLYRLGTAAWEIIQTILSGIGDVFTQMWDIGSNIVSGIWEGISAGYTWITNKINGWIGDVVGFFKRILGIASPSKVFSELGGFMAAGVGVGIESNLGMVESAVGDLSDAAINAWDADGLSVAIDSTRTLRPAARFADQGDASLAETIVMALNGCGVYMDGQIVGRLVTKAQANTARAFG